MPAPVHSAARNLLLAVALGAACGGIWPAQAAEQRMSREAYAAAKDAIAERHSKALAHCKTVDGGAQSRCRMQADGREKIDLATLEVRWHPSANNNFKASMAEVDLAYALAMDQCKKQHTGSDKESKAALKSCSDKAKGKRVAGEQAAHQQAALQASVGAPPKSEAERQREADLDTAIRKCDSLLGDANLQCMNALSPQARQRAADRSSGAARQD